MNQDTVNYIGQTTLEAINEAIIDERNKDLKQVESDVRDISEIQNHLSKMTTLTW